MSNFNELVICHPGSRAPFCPPAQTPPEQSLAVPSGAALVGILKPTRLFSLATQLVEPDGWWMNAANGDVVRRVAALRSQSVVL